jgi:hypothetical protein
VTGKNIQQGQIKKRASALQLIWAQPDHEMRGQWLKEAHSGLGSGDLHLK